MTQRKIIHVDCDCFYAAIEMLGLERAARGCVRVFGEDITQTDSARLQQLRNHWGMLFQEGALYSALTVFENVAQPLRELNHLPPELVRDRSGRGQFRARLANDVPTVGVAERTPYARAS